VRNGEQRIAHTGNPALYLPRASVRSSHLRLDDISAAQLLFTSEGARDSPQCRTLPVARWFREKIALSTTHRCDHGSHGGPVLNEPASASLERIPAPIFARWGEYEGEEVDAHATKVRSACVDAEAEAQGALFSQHTWHHPELNWRAPSVS
jgi:hypothetical protein